MASPKKRVTNIRSRSWFMNGLVEPALLPKATSESDIKGIATHPEDDLIIATAIDDKAEVIVTGDKRLRLVTPDRVLIVNPDMFIELIQKKRDQDQLSLIKL